MRILVVDDERDLSTAIARAIAAAGFATDVAFDGEEALRLADAFPYDAVVLDLLLPRRHGLSVLRELRKTSPRLPILVLTALDMTEERIDGLERGADDYLVKPFAMAELLARLRAILRRGSRSVTGAVVCLGDVEIDLTNHVVRRGGRPVSLTERQFAVLSHLVNRHGEVVTPDEIGSHVLDRDYEEGSNYIAVLMCEIRRRLGRPDVIRTVWGAGYRLAAPGAP